jgi:hypothetical protein
MNRITAALFPHFTRITAALEPRHIPGGITGMEITTVE